MWDLLRDFWLPRLLFVTTLALAVLFALVVLCAPWVAEKDQPGLLALFAGDAIVRRTTVAGAVGLAVTACVFFRPGGFLFLRSRAEKKTPPPMAGA